MSRFGRFICHLLEFGPAQFPPSRPSLGLALSGRTPGRVRAPGRRLLPVQPPPSPSRAPGRRLLPRAASSLPRAQPLSPACPPAASLAVRPPPAPLFGRRQPRCSAVAIPASFGLLLLACCPAALSHTPAVRPPPAPPPLACCCSLVVRPPYPALPPP
jgi:hypothetical protein